MVTEEADLKKFARIFAESSEIESMIDYILDNLKIEYKRSSFQDKISKFCVYIDNRDHGKKSTDKIFLERYSLVDLLSGIKKYSDIARHEANNLLTGFSEVPLKARRGKFSKQYIGNLDSLYSEFTKYTKALYPLYEMIQMEGDFRFDNFDIDGLSYTS